MFIVCAFADKKCFGKIKVMNLRMEIGGSKLEALQAHLDIHYKQPQKTINVCGCLWFFVVNSLELLVTFTTKFVVTPNNCSIDSTVKC